MKKITPITVFLFFLLLEGMFLVLSPKVDAALPPVYLSGYVKEEVVPEAQITKNELSPTQKLVSLISWLDVAVAEAGLMPEGGGAEGGGMTGGIQGVLVSARSGSRTYATLTDANGFYRLALYRNKTYTVTFSKIRYETKSYTIYMGTTNKSLSVFLKFIPPGAAVPTITSPTNGTTFRLPARNSLDITIVASDTDTADIVTIQVTGLPPWAFVDNGQNDKNPATVVIRGAPPVDAIGRPGDPPHSFSATATDAVNTSAATTINLYVTRFKDATSASGIFSHPGGDTADTRTVDFGDIDGDGDLDILTCTFGMHHYGWPLEDAGNVPAPYFETEFIRLYQNNGNRTFTDITEQLGYNPDAPCPPPIKYWRGICTPDILRWRGGSAKFVYQGTHPTLPDIAINSAANSTGFGGNFTLLQNDGTGRFDNPAYPPIPKWNRGNEDVTTFYSNPADATNKPNWATIVMNSGSTTVSANSRIYDKDMVERTVLFPPHNSTTPHQECISEVGDLAAGDFDSDGDQDLVISGLAVYQDTGAFYRTDQCYHYQEGGGVQLFHTQKDRKKATVLFRNRGATPGGVGDLEDITATEMPPETSYPWPSSINTGIATPTWFDIYVYERHTEFADLDGDNDLDIFIADPTPGTGATLYRDAILINDGTGFQYLPGRLNWQVYRDIDVKIGDVDLDSHPDIVLIPLKGQIKLLRPNQTLSWFVPHIEWTFPVSPADDKINNAIALGDLDNDGDLDVYVAKDGEDLLYLNMTNE